VQLWEYDNNLLIARKIQQLTTSLLFFEF